MDEQRFLHCRWEDMICQAFPVDLIEGWEYNSNCCNKQTAVDIVFTFASAVVMKNRGCHPADIIKTTYFVLMCACMLQIL